MGNALSTTWRMGERYVVPVKEKQVLNLRWMGRHLDILGTIDGSVNCKGQTMTMTGSKAIVTKDVTFMGERLVLGGDAKIVGNLQAFGKVLEMSDCSVGSGSQRDVCSFFGESCFVENNPKLASFICLSTKFRLEPGAQLDIVDAAGNRGPSGAWDEQGSGACVLMGDSIDVQGTVNCSEFPGVRRGLRVTWKKDFTIGEEGVVNGDISQTVTRDDLKDELPYLNSKWWEWVTNPDSPLVNKGRDRGGTWGQGRHKGGTWTAAKSAPAGNAGGRGAGDKDDRKDDDLLGEVRILGTVNGTVTALRCNELIIGRSAKIEGGIVDLDCNTLQNDSPDIKISGRVGGLRYATPHDFRYADWRTLS